MAPLHSLTGIFAFVLVSSCGAFIVPGPTQQVSRGTAGVAAPGAALSGAPRLTSRVPSRAAVLRDSASPFSGGTSRAVCRSAVVRRRPAGALKAVSGAGSEGGGESEEKGRDLSGLRRAVLLAVWLPFTAYAFGPWSPGAAGDPKDIELVTHLYDTVGPQTAIFFSIFNGLGVLPGVVASILCGGGAFGKGRQPVPPQPFVFGAFALGFFSVGPYLALRNYLPEVDADEEVSLLEKVLTSKIAAVPLLAGAVSCFVSAVVALQDPAAIAGFSELFWSSKLVHISSLDALVLSVAIVDPIREDMRRRGMEPEIAKVALFAVPLVGPALWLLVRPACVRE